MFAALPTILQGLPWVLCAFLFGMWQWDRADLADAQAAQAAAVIAAQVKADTLGAQLILAEQKAQAATAQKVITYVDRVQSSPDDAARNVAGSLGVRDIIYGSSSPGTSGPPAGVPRPSTGSGPQ